MKDDIQQQRNWAVQRFLNGEKAESICASLNHSRAWLYKWIERFHAEDDNWSRNHSPRPLTLPTQTLPQIEEHVKVIRHNLYTHGMFYGAQAIRWEMEDSGIHPVPSIRTINRILSRNGLLQRHNDGYVAKGTAYPKLPSLWPNQTHQVDLVGPCYLQGAVRFYSINVVDIATSRCGIHPAESKSGQCIIDALWTIWSRMGIPRNLQMDNDSSFYGSPTHPRGMGPLIRLCLHQGVEPWFIPMAEPWRNGVVEKFNDQYRQRFLNKVPLRTKTNLITESLAFEQRHNSTYRYSKLGGKTPLKALQASKCSLRFPMNENPPQHRMKKPVYGRYHLVRFIRGNRQLNIFGELFPTPSELVYEYVVATIDVAEQKLKLYLDKTLVEVYNYNLR